MQWKCWSILLPTFFLFNVADALLSQDTLYDYNGRILYIYLHNQDLDETSSTSAALNKIFKIPFNSKLTSGESLLNTTISSPPNGLCELVVATSALYSFCPSNDNDLLSINEYDPIANEWNLMSTQTNTSYLNGSSYLFTGSDPNAVYIFSGSSFNNSSRQVSDQMLRLDLISGEYSDASSRIQPSPFYKSTNLQINSNTQALFGGVSKDNSLVEMSEIPVWQYNSWAERPCENLNLTNINPRINSLVLPVFSNSNQYIINTTITDFDVSSVLLLGGTDLNNTNVNPQFASLNVSSTVWKWNDISDTITNANSSFSLDNILGAATVYDTLITITRSSKITKRSTNNDLSNIIVQLYNATTFEYIDQIDYSKLNNLVAVNHVVVHTNRNTIIALSVIIPILVIIIISTILFLLYKRYKLKKEEERNEMEIKEIVDFYENQHKQHSDLTFSTLSTDYKSFGDDSYHESGDDKIFMKDYNDDDDLSINSWRKKRIEFEKEKYNLTTKQHKANYSHSNSLLRSLSIASNFIQGSLSRKNSTQSSIATFVTANTSNQIKDIINSNNSTFNTENSNPKDKNFEASSIINENPFDTAASLYTIHSNDAYDLEPPPSVPKHSQLLMFPNRTNSTLHHIPEDASVSTFHSKNLGFISMKQAYQPQQHYNYSPQKNYMKQIGKHTSNLSYSSTSNSSIYSSPTRSPRRPLSMISTISSTSNDLYPFNNIPPLIEHENENGLNVEVDDNNNGDIDNDYNEMHNLDAQVLVGSKRRSKLRVVNPDESNNSESESIMSIIDINKQKTNDSKSRISSSSSENNNESSKIRKRVVSDEHNDESFSK